MTVRPNTRLERLLTYLADRAGRGQPLPTTDAIAQELAFAGAWDVTHLLTQAKAKGLLTVEYRGPFIAAIAATDGRWRLDGAVPGRRAAELPPRRCLRCRTDFTPPHKGRFLCAPCCAYAESAA